MKDDRSISLNAAIDAVHKNYDTILDFESDGKTIAYSIEDILSGLPSAQPERKKGRWIIEPGIGYFCSNCNFYIDNDIQIEYANYCPMCGADMRDDDHD